MSAEEEGSEDWSVDDYRGDHESDEHWTLRRNFLVQNKGRYPRLRLLSLSQVFANMEFLGCRYPEETMDLVGELSTGIIEEYRKARQGRLQRTFVKASDAAEKKTKGTKRHYPVNSATHENKIFVKESTTSSSNSFSSSGTPNGNRISGTAGTSTEKGPLSSSYEEALNEYGEDLRGLVIVNQMFLDNEGPLQIINRSCGMSHKQLAFDYSNTIDGLTTCYLKIGNSVISEGKAYNKDTARQEAATRGLEKLRKLCYTIEVKAVVVSAVEFSKTDIKGVNGVIKSEHEGRISEDNVGNKLLKLMGWQGGGLGKDQQGIETPVMASPASEVVQRSRLGLGLSSPDADFSGAIKKFLTSQMWQCAQFDLRFSPEFNTDERKVIHQVAGQLGLKSRSHGKGDNRFLVVSRKIQLLSLVQELLEMGETDKYRVIEPELLSPSFALSGDSDR